MQAVYDAVMGNYDAAIRRLGLPVVLLVLSMRESPRKGTPLSYAIWLVTVLIAGNLAMRILL